MNSSPSFLLWTFPCGCVVDDSTIRVHEADAIVECPWCPASFFAEELHAWLYDGCGPWIMLQRAPRTLLGLGDDVLEIIDRCNCGAPLVRKYQKQEVTHLSVPVQLLRWLDN